ncbi:hypothetical protein BYZ73_13215 [Rhodovulum viride]|uniref:Protein gp37 n=1 Tax=Rhodovulum viride TaxID=1231134 RepID=A0ABX9DGB2_9RHOB|nr:phage Gp37/Gp68 family protein [Rhodovulum viride]RAP40729.1 hypothetical protein BYZ73_13215 [Rhodovulum viride]
MSDHTHIEWTDSTWNPITGCSIVSAGCTNCYAMGLAGTRLKHHPSRAGLTRESGGRHLWTGEVRFNEEWIDQPLRWRKPRRIFVCAHGDLFHEAVPDEWIDRVFAVMALAPQHTFQVVTKRPERMRDYLTEREDREIGRAMDRQLTGPHPVPVLRNVWLGTSIEDQATADARIPHLLATPAAVRFVSAEPLLGPVSLEPFLPWPDSGGELPDGTAFGCYDCDGGTCSNCPKDHAHYACEEGPRDAEGCPEWVHCERVTLDWVIVGGESGLRARPMHPDWVRVLRDQCQAAGAAFFFKQWGEWGPQTPYPVPAQLGEMTRFTITASTDRRRVGATVWRAGHGIYLPSEIMDRNGKRAAGRLLDGRAWDEMPEPTNGDLDHG